MENKKEILAKHLKINSDEIDIFCFVRNFKDKELYSAMQEYSDQQNKELLEQLASKDSDYSDLQNRNIELKEQLANELKRNEFLEQTSGLQIEGKDSRIIINDLKEQLAEKEKELSEVKDLLKYTKWLKFNYNTDSFTKEECFLKNIPTSENVCFRSISDGEKYSYTEVVDAYELFLIKKN